MRIFQSDETMLVEECSAFLEGRYADLCEDRREPVPLELEVASCRAAERWRPGQLFTGLLGTLPSAHRRGPRAD